MPDYIVKLPEAGERCYLIWSTIFDASITHGRTRTELESFIKNEYGREGLDRLPERLRRVETKGTSAFGDKDADDTISNNRAGPNDAARRYGERSRLRFAGGHPR